MNTLRLYLSIFIDGKHSETVVYRDLSSLELGWKEKTNPSTTGIVHISFIRPKIKFNDNRPELLGNLMVTISSKWSLPKAYESTESPIAIIEIDQTPTPCYLIKSGFGINLETSQYQSLLMPAEAQPSAKTNSGNKNTISYAAQEVLRKVGKPLNKEEIFAHIIQEDLYTFGAKKPIDVLGIELNRNTVGSNYSKSSDAPCFGKTSDDKFYYIDSAHVEMSGWLKVLQNDIPKTASELIPYGIYDEDSFDQNIDLIPATLLKIAVLYRYQILKENVNKKDPHQLLRVIPREVLDEPIYSLGFSVRVENVLNAQNFETLRDVMPYQVDEMLQWANFGRKSVNDFCLRIIELCDKLAEGIKDIENTSIGNISPENHTNGDEEVDRAFKTKVIEKTPLIEHFENTLFNLGDKERKIIELRTGSNGPALTLQAVAEKMGITRERVRQIQKKYVEKVIQVEYWDDCIAIKIGQLLASRKEPLYLEMLELEDEWFKGFIGNYHHLKAIIELFSENEIRVINIAGSNIVTRIKQDTWDEIVRETRKSLKDKAEERQWSRSDIEVLLYSHLNKVGTPELTGLLFKEFNDALQFSGEGDRALLVAFGKSAESAVAAVLEQAEAPLHYSEIASRATELLGKLIDERRAQNALIHQKAKSFGRGIYGLDRFNPINERMCHNIRLVVTKMMYEGPLLRQWHSSEILIKLQEQFPSLPKELDTYILNIILEKEERLSYLNRMVWARSDSDQYPDDRIDIADAFTKLLEDNAGPMKGSDLRKSLREIRGVNGLQIQPNERMIQIGPDLWGLIERDTGASQQENDEALDFLYVVLEKKQKGIHVSEVESIMHDSSLSNYPAPYILFNLAQRDNRFHLVQAMFLGLASWGGDVRRLNINQAVRKIIGEMTAPMPIAEIQMMTEKYTELKLEHSVAGVLIDNNAIYDSVNKTWFKQ